MLRKITICIFIITLLISSVTLFSQDPSGSWTWICRGSPGSDTWDCIDCHSPFMGDSCGAVCNGGTWEVACEYYCLYSACDYGS